MNAICIIPARLESSRLSQKLLLNLGECSIIEHVYRHCIEAAVFTHVLIAVDDELLFNHCRTFCPYVIMTSKHHSSGTDRIYEAYLLSGLTAEYIVNVQADEPMLGSEHIASIVQAHDRSTVNVMTARSRISDSTELCSPSCVKVVIDDQEKALYFTRSIIPFVRDEEQDTWIDHHVFWKHVGIYSYTLESLQTFISLEKSSLEQAEQLEQLRLLNHGYSYGCTEIVYSGFGIDTIEDYVKAQEMYR